MKILKYFTIFAYTLLLNPIFGAELADKARLFDKMIESRHLPFGLVVNVKISKNHGKLIPEYSGDSTIWTGAYICSQVYRYRVNKSPQALKNIHKCLRAFVKLHKMSSGKGFLGRTFGPAENFRNNPRYFLYTFHIQKNYYQTALKLFLYCIIFHLSFQYNPKDSNMANPFPKIHGFRD